MDRFNAQGFRRGQAGLVPAVLIVYMPGCFAQADGRLDDALPAPSGMEGIQCPLIRAGVRGQDRPQRRFAVVHVTGGPLVPSQAGVAGSGRQVFDPSRRMPVRQAREPSVNGTAPFRGIVAPPVEDGKNVDDPVSSAQVGLNAARHRRLGIPRHGCVLLRGVAPDVAARNDPQHAVIVKRHVPLDVPGSALQDIVRVGHERTVQGRIEIAVPSGGTVVSHGVAHEHHFRRRRVVFGEEHTAHALSVLVQPELEGRRCFPIAQIRRPRDVKPRLGRSPPHVARRRAPGRLVPPDLALTVHEDFVASAQDFEVPRRDHAAEDQVTLVQEPVPVDADHTPAPRHRPTLSRSAFM